MTRSRTLVSAVLIAVLPAGAMAGTLSARELDELVAPVALYPDTALTDILVASTYPAQVVEAERFASDPAHMGWQGAALTQAAASENWDPSVKALLMFPPVLQMMDSNLSWTEKLGEAVIAQQQDVMDAVQTLREQAQLAGTLASTPQESVVNEGADIAIEPPSGQMVYLPTYAPQCVYGANPACDDASAEGVYWDTGIFLPYGYVSWAVVNWPARAVVLGGDRLAPRSLENVWRPNRARHPAFDLRASKIVAGNIGSGEPRNFNYAPAANEPFGHVNVYSRTALPTHFLAPSAPRAFVTRPPAFAPAHPFVIAHPAVEAHR